MDHALKFLITLFLTACVSLEPPIESAPDIEVRAVESKKKTGDFSLRINAKSANCIAPVTIDVDETLACVRLHKNLKIGKALIAKLKSEGIENFATLSESDKLGKLATLDQDTGIVGTSFEGIYEFDEGARPSPVYWLHSIDYVDMSEG